MKKLSICMCLAIALLMGQVYAVDFSVGLTTPGFGISILRGNAVDGAAKNAESLNPKTEFGLSLVPLAQVDFIVEFLPFLALETGVGYGTSTISSVIDNPAVGGKFITTYKRDGIIIPLMARGQYDFGMISVYGSVGPKFVIPLSDYESAEVNGTEGDLNRADDYYNKFIVDLGFAIGAEYNIADVHYVGLRVGYDLNLISPIKDDTESMSSDGTFKLNEWYHDALAVSLTYRFAL